MIKPYSSGHWSIEYALVAITSCGEKMLFGSEKRSFEVGLGAPSVLIQDPFSLDTPTQVVVSESGRFALHIFKDWYRVYDEETGALIVDRPGRSPNFSPTSRFVAAESGLTGDQVNESLDIVDLLTGEVVGHPETDLLGWLNNDAILVTAGKDETAAGSWEGSVEVLQPLVSDSGSLEKLADNVSFVGKDWCHACVPWNGTGISFDQDKGTAIYGRLDGTDAVECYLSGHSCGDVGKPQLGIGWKAMTYSHLKAHLSGIDVFHHHILPPDQARKTAVQGLTFATRGGDWRGAPNMRSTVLQQSASTRLVDQIPAFGIVTEALANVETLWPTPAWTAVEEKGEAFVFSTEVQSLFTTAVADIKRALARDFPDMLQFIGENDTFPYGGILQPGSKIDLKNMIGAWRWYDHGVPLYLIQLWKLEGTVHAPNGALFLLDGRRDAAKRLLSGEDGLLPILTRVETRLKVRITANGYLLYSLSHGGDIRAYDLNRRQQLREFPLGDSLLLDDFRITSDARHIIQINSDGQFFVYETKKNEHILSGVFVDEEILLYTSDGYFWSSYEGSGLVHIRFPGMKGLHTFQQFASQLDKPNIIRDILAGKSDRPTRPQLKAPPQLAVTLSENETRVHLSASADVGLRSVRIFADGQPVKLVSIEGRNAEKDIDLIEVANARVITALAVDENGLISLPQTVSRKGRTKRGRLLGLFIGINKYIDPEIRQLTEAVHDASNAEAAFKATSAHNYTTAETTLLVDEAAHSSAIAAAIKRFIGRAEPADTLVVFFAGHGVRSKAGNFYLVDSGFNTSSPDQSGLPWAELAKMLSQVKSRVILFLDACHSGSIGSELATNDGAVSDLFQALDRPIIVFAAAKGRQYSFESEAIGGGFFTDALTRILTTDRAQYDLTKMERWKSASFIWA